MSPKHKKAALVTGGARRIGRHLAVALAGMGYEIALHYHSSKNDAARTAAEVRRLGHTCRLICHDLSRPEGPALLWSDAFRHFPGLDVLVNNASVFLPSTLKKGSAGIWERDLAVNLRAPYLLTAEMARHCRRGQVINILDTHIASHRSAHTAYLLAKKALRDLTCMAAMELAPDFRVNGIAPGLILPPASRSKSYLTRLAKHVPLRRKGDPDHVVEAVAFLVRNDYVTGQILFIDGGEHLLGPDNLF